MSASRFVLSEENQRMLLRARLDARAQVEWPAKFDALVADLIAESCVVLRRAGSDDMSAIICTIGKLKFYRRSIGPLEENSRQLLDEMLNNCRPGGVFPSAWHERIERLVLEFTELFPDKARADPVGQD